MFFSKFTYKNLKFVKWWIFKQPRGRNQAGSGCRFPKTMVRSHLHIHSLKTPNPIRIYFLETFNSFSIYFLKTSQLLSFLTGQRREKFHFRRSVTKTFISDRFLRQNEMGGQSNLYNFILKKMKMLIKIEKVWSFSRNVCKQNNAFCHRLSDCSVFLLCIST